MLSPNVPAQLFYEASDFEIVRPGSFVLCAVSGARIELSHLTLLAPQAVLSIAIVPVMMALVGLLDRLRLLRVMRTG